MIVRCAHCRVWYDDEFRTTLCPHDVFLANDGNNNFFFKYDAYLGQRPPERWERNTDQNCG